MPHLSSSEPLSAATTACFIGATVICHYLFGANRSDQPQYKIENIRKKLPNDLLAWRNPLDTDGEPSGDPEHWQSLREVFAVHGYALWSHVFCFAYHKPGLREGNRDIAQNGFAYSTPLRSRNEPGGIVHLYNFGGENHSCHPATAKDGRSVVLRILKVQREGQQHLDIIKYLARGPTSLYSHNHALSLLQEIQIEDITFGVFPFVGGAVQESYGSWAKNSVGDVVDMILQMLSALAFIHSHRIAHRDAYKDNFLVQWHPESLLALPPIAVERPRVYLHDFEAAVQFPEVLSGAPYDPYKVDIWQLGSSLANMKTTVAEIDEVLAAMIEPDTSKRLSATEIADSLKTIVYAMPAIALAIPPSVRSEEANSPGHDGVFDKD
ncbi:kinase-like domain-containing protein [Daedaleopsis nitida]|nr:kinase-like domain-containing protein [Daedaleopsis nitida]